VDLVGWLTRFETLAVSQGWSEALMKERLPLTLAGSALTWCSARMMRKAKRPKEGEHRRKGAAWSDMAWKDVKGALLDAFLPADFETHLRDLLDAPQKKEEDVVLFFHSKMGICNQLGCSSPEAVRVITRSLRGEHRTLLGAGTFEHTDDLLKHLKQVDVIVRDNRRVSEQEKEINRLRRELKSLKRQSELRPRVGAHRAPGSD
jgi:hypothetical protein